jgi:hypothetical protein
MTTAFANVDAQAKPSPVTMRLTAGATLTGSVTDESGFPLPHASVEVIERIVSNGRGRLASLWSVPANDLGEFRIAGRAAGRYLVCANATASSYQKHHRLTYTTTCFPDVTDPALAQWVNLGPGEERKLAFHLTPVHGIRVSGSVDNARKWTSVSIKRTDPPGFPRLMNDAVEWDEKTSTFTMLALSPGDYLITANSNDNAVYYRAMHTISAGADDIRDIRLTLREVPYLSGTVRMGDTPAAPQSQINVGYGYEVLSIRANAGGTFKSQMPEPGQYSVMVFPPPGWYLQAITQGADDIRDRKIVFDADTEPAPIEIELAQGGGTIDVSFQNASAKSNNPIRVTLLQRLSTTNEWVEQGQPMTTYNGVTFTLRDVPPGEYTVFAWPVTAELEYLNPDVLEKYQSYGQSVTVRESETTRVTVKPVEIE